MTTVMKVDIALRAEKDVIVTTSFEHLVTNEDDAQQLGTEDAKFMNAYMLGFGDWKP